MRLLRKFSRSASSSARGRLAERAARRWLRRRGFIVLSTNYTTKAGEIDVVATEGDTLCFIEIKARRDARFGIAVEAVSAAKQLRIARAASLFLAESGWQGPCRFDVLGIDRSRDRWRFELLRDAFSVPASS